MFMITLNMVSSGRSGWGNRLCVVNILVIVSSLAALKYKLYLGLIPAVLVCGFDVFICSYVSLQCVYSLVIDSIRTIISTIITVAVGTLAMMYGQALVQILTKNKFL